MTTNGWALTIQAWRSHGRRAKATTKVRRYSASGTTQSNGTAARSVVMWVVTASSRLDGTSASTSQRSRRGQPIASAARHRLAARRRSRRRRGRQTTRPQPVIARAKAP